ncbi:hypothetical protein FPZ12_020655 [Amycolatopsis acidicola]|uniref:CBU-0592-like domain-containing protein n=1 Tax=Amycolatopsis acidicola TaxID=2596893 RepID=A0A5N0UZ77_9PSEU|nr:hypothetical protein [Amycolatopsis acidicola]KAA9159315.1 hypothetical protein FPZ12_020655 [Amycolatopsis acidicola]
MNEGLSVVASVAGWLGGLGTAGAYVLATRRIIAPGSLVFQILNAAGGALLALSGAVSGAWPSATVNFVWMVIGVQALVGTRFVFRRRFRDPAAEAPDPVEAETAPTEQQREPVASVH